MNHHQAHDCSYTSQLPIWESHAKISSTRSHTRIHATQFFYTLPHSHTHKHIFTNIHTNNNNNNTRQNTHAVLTLQPCLSFTETRVVQTTHARTANMHTRKLFQTIKQQLHTVILQSRTFGKLTKKNFIDCSISNFDTHRISKKLMMTDKDLTKQPHGDPTCDVTRTRIHMKER